MNENMNPKQVSDFVKEQIEFSKSKNMNTEFVYYALMYQWSKQVINQQAHLKKLGVDYKQVLQIALNHRAEMIKLVNELKIEDGF